MKQLLSGTFAFLLLFTMSATPARAAETDEPAMPITAPVEEPDLMFLFNNIAWIKDAAWSPNSLEMDTVNPKYASYIENAEYMGKSNFKNFLEVHHGDWTCTDKYICTKYDNEDSLKETYTLNLNTNTLIWEQPQNLSMQMVRYFLDINTGRAVAVNEDQWLYCVSDWQSGKGAMNCYDAMEEDPEYRRVRKVTINSVNQVVDGIYPFLKHAADDFYSRYRLQ